MGIICWFNIGDVLNGLFGCVVILCFLFVFCGLCNLFRFICCLVVVFEDVVWFRYV